MSERLIITPEEYEINKPWNYEKMLDFMTVKIQQETIIIRKRLKEQ